MLIDSQKYIEEGPYGRYGGYLRHQHFSTMLFLAFTLHICGYALYAALPSGAVEEIPVRVLNIKFGGLNSVVDTASEPAELGKIEPAAGGTTSARVTESQIKKEQMDELDTKAAMSALESQISEEKNESKPHESKMETDPVKAVQESYKAQNIRKPTVVSKPQTNNTLKPPAKKAPHQYVREAPAPKGLTASHKGSILGNSSSDDAAEIEKRYTQTISLWLKRHKIYPVEAKNQGIHGIALIHVRLDRRGNVLTYQIEKSTGHQILDRAISIIVSNANPFPPVPSNYPDPSSVLDFKMYINFRD